MRSTLALGISRYAISRRRYAAAVVTTIVLGVAGCTSDSTPTVYVDLAYQVRCLDCDSHAPDDTPREVKVVDGEDGYQLECEVKKVGGVRRVTLAANHLDATSTDNHAFRVELANLDGDDSSLQCTVKVIEGVQIYEGACSSDTPDVSGGPCQANFRVEKGVIKGAVLCDGLPVEATPEITRYLLAPGGTRDEPAQIQVYGCRGL
jgi:hypothetical protein